VDPPQPTATNTVDPPPPSGTGTSSCTFESAPQPVSEAFCETFNQPAGIGNRAGGLNGTLWGVSRNTGQSGIGGGIADDWTAPVAANQCGQQVSVSADKDVTICNGQLSETSNDGGTVSSLAIYPKQPFDFAGRTGTVVFDVSDNSQGTHAAWPEFWMTDKPVPDPFVHNTTWYSVPQNGFGLRFGSVCKGQSGCGFWCAHAQAASADPNAYYVTVDSAVVVRNYVPEDLSYLTTGASFKVNAVGCVKEATGPGNNNHVELRISQNEIDVYATDAGTMSPLYEIATITNANLTLTRGLIWLGDGHYNGDKFNTQRTNTFTWDNVGFDGPILPRDLAFDVPDALVPGIMQQDTVDTGLQLGYDVPADGTSLKLTVPEVYNVAKAQAGLLTLNYTSTTPVTLSYSLNGNAWHTVPWPFPAGNGVTSWQTIAIPISLAEVVTGNNTLELKTSAASLVSNLDLIMVGAAGVVPPTS
jgi:hypothetical protein